MLSFCVVLDLIMTTCGVVYYQGVIDYLPLGSTVVVVMMLILYISHSLTYMVVFDKECWVLINWSTNLFSILINFNPGIFSITHAVVFSLHFQQSRLFVPTYSTRFVIISQRNWSRERKGELFMTTELKCTYLNLPRLLQIVTRWDPSNINIQ